MMLMQWTPLSAHDMTGVLGRGDPLCFRTQGAMFCRCPMKDGEFCVMDLTMYPQLGMLGSKKTGLLDVKHVPWGACFWKEALRQPYGIREINVVKAPTIPMGWGYFIQIFFTGMDRDGSPMQCSWVCRAFGGRDGRSLLAHLMIIQKAVRGFVRSRREARDLAVMMGLHARLGAKCRFSSIPEDVIAHKILNRITVKQ